VVCLGIRSIGTSLSAVVCAALEDRGCRVQSCTVRCTGHPFDRRLTLDPAWEGCWRAAARGHFLIVDEGPGLSGSSSCSVAQKLADLGVPDDRIILFPSRSTDGADLNCAAARARWPRHRKYLVGFEDYWIASGRLARSLPGGPLADLSAGRWRSLFFAAESDYPGVQPWHERRKYLSSMGVSRGASGPRRSCDPRARCPCYDESGWQRQAESSELGDGLAAVICPIAQTDSRHLLARKGPAVPLLLKFAGLGRYGRALRARAVALAEAGFHPPCSA